MLGVGLREIETITARWEWLDWDRRVYVPGENKRSRELSVFLCANR